MGMEFENLTCQELCDLMCGKPEEEDDRDCEKCRFYKKVHGKDYMACSKWDCKFEPKTN